MRILFQPEIEYDPAKNQSNIQKHGYSFELAKSVDWAQALIKQDNRKDYKEIRFVAFVKRLDVLLTLVFTMRKEKMRVISLRMSNGKEVFEYESKANTKISHP